LSDVLCALLQHSADVTLQSLTSFAYCVHAVEVAQQARYG